MNECSCDVEGDECRWGVGETKVGFYIERMAVCGDLFGLVDKFVLMLFF